MHISRIGFVGLGIMGSRMAAMLKQRGFDVTVFNRSRDKAEALKAKGLKVADSPRELAQQVDALITCVADPKALRDVTDGPNGLMAGAKAGQLIIDCSTISVELVQELSAEWTAKGCDFLDAPVTGSKAGAEKGTLVIMVGATEAALKRANPVLLGMGEKIIHCGPVGAGTQVKLAGNLVIAGMLQSFSEGMLLTSKAGADPRKLIEVIQSSGFRSPYFDFKGQALLNHDFETHFSIDLMHKDLSLFVENASANQVPAPTAASLKETYNLARAAGKGGLDITAVISVFEDLLKHRIQ